MTGRRLNKATSDYGWIKRLRCDGSFDDGQDNTEVRKLKEVTRIPSRLRLMPDGGAASTRRSGALTINLLGGTGDGVDYPPPHTVVKR